MSATVLAPPSLAQSESASVSGRITDQQNAVIPNVEVEMRNVDTNSTHVTKTNGDGIYSFPSLRPGNYVISVRKEQFQTVSVTGVILNVQDNLSRNFVLQVGSSAVSVTVTANDLHMNTTDASVSTVVDRQFAENLPLNGRSFQTLIQLTPGVVLTNNNGRDSGQFSVNGQRASSNYWTVDGVSANIGIGSAGGPGNGLGGALGSFSVLGGTNSLVSIDALQEFRIQTSTFAPEFGRTPGAQISIVTRSGTNSFHGTVFEYLRNDILDANNWFANSARQPKPNERQSDFGGTLSGPILKDKTFFFFSYEGLRLRLPQTALTLVPDENARQVAVVSIQPYLNMYPLPNGPAGTDNLATGVAQFNSSFSNPGSLDAYSLRIDHKFRESFSIFGRYNYSPSRLDQRGGLGTSLSTVEPQRITTQTATLGSIWNTSSTAVNDFRFNYSTTDASSFSYSDDFGGATALTSVPFPNSLTVRNARLTILNFGLGTNGALNVGSQEHNRQQQINIVDSLSVQKGSHAIKSGVDFRRLSPLVAPDSYLQEPIFVSVLQAEGGTPAGTVLISNSDASFRFLNLGIFAQDTWRIFSRLTLTYGLRWDTDFVPTSLSGPDFSAVLGFNLKDLSTLTLAPTGTPPYKTTYGNFAPRIGLAYQVTRTPNWQTVFRAGYGLFYDLASSEAGNIANAGIYPFGIQALVFGSFPLSPAAALPPPITPPDPTSGLFAFDPHLKLPYTQQWNVTLEQALGAQQTISGSYIGSVGRRLLQTAFINAPNPRYGSAVLVTNAATSDYDALQLQYRRQLSHGVQALASYTWSHSIDTASAGSIGSGSNDIAALDPTVNRGPSNFDIRHAFSTGLTYDVPAPKINVFTNAILRGWSTENFFQAFTAPPVNPFYGSFRNLSNGFVSAVRPNRVQGQPLYLDGSQYPGGKAINPAAFAGPPLGPNGLPTAQGDLARNALRGFGAYQWDFAVHRDFPIHERLKLQFRAEMFNVLNHPNFGQPVANLGAPTAPNPQFGRSTQTLAQSLSGTFGVGGGAFNPLYQIGGPRSMQLALRIAF